MPNAPLHRILVASFTIVTLIGLAWLPTRAQESDAEEAKEAAVVARFVTVLEKNPRRGTALDKIYGFHVERGSLDGLIQTYRTKDAAAKGAEASSAWMIVGLLESLRGQDAASVEAFTSAEQLDAANYLAPYYLGQALVLVGQPDKAAEALERAIQRNPAQSDQLDIYQALGRIYQRAQKNDKALEVWNRLEKQFPNDARVQEQIATTLLEENEFAAAMPRFENLAKTSKDKYRQSLFQMEVAEINVRLGKSADAIREFESLLGQLNPDNWLFREVRRRIENVYLRTDDQAGLIKYYEGWIKKNPEDLEAISRLARLLAGMGRGPEAQNWLQKGLKTAPSRKDLRNALIGQLVYEQKFPEAIAQYEQLDKYEPNNPDTLRDWGRLILKDSSRDEATRKKDAAAVWRRLTSAKPKDPLIALQVAELFRQAEMVDEALALYRQAVELAPDAAQYKEYLGEYFHSLQRKDEALATWRQMADGKSKTAANLARLSEVLAGFGYLAEAITANTEACKLDPKDLNLQIKQSDLLSQADRHDEALKQLIVVQKLAANDEEREAWLQRELKELQTLEQLKGRIAATQKELNGRPNRGTTAASEKEKQDLSDKWFWLARAYEAERQLKEAAESVATATELAPQSIPILMASARILEAQNNLLAAVEINTKLAAIDRRYRTEYLKKVAQLEVQLGRRDKAIQAGRDLLAAAPGNPELYEFFSQLCFQLGAREEGLQALRRSVRVNPTEPKGLLLLASALGEQFRTGEAIELYWRAFDKAGSLDDRLGVVPKLTELYLQTNQFDRLLERLERQRREPNQQREMTICLAQAYQSAGDDGNARQELEKLLTEDTRDTQLLQQLVKLCESDGDLEAAIRFQQQMNKSAPGKEGVMRLAQLLMKSGDTDEATALLTRATSEEKDPEQLIKSIDSLLTQKNYEQVLGITDRLVREQPRNWDLLYREGVALSNTKPEEATRRFEGILALPDRDDEETLITRNQTKKNQGRLRNPVMQMREMNPLMQRVQYTWQIRQAIGLDQEGYYGNQPQQQPFWSPHDFGTARLASLGWLNLLARNSGKEDEFISQRRALAEKSEDMRVLIDWYYFSSLRNESKDQYEVLKRLSYRPDADVGIKSMYLTSLSGRGGPQARQIVNQDTGETELTLEPLDKQELEHVLACYSEIGHATSMINYGETFLELVAAELKRAGRGDDASRMLQDAIDSAKSPVEIASVLAGTVQRGDYETALKLLNRLVQLKPDTGAASPNIGGGFNYAQYVSTPAYQAQILAQLMAKRAEKKELQDVLALWNRYLPLAVARYESDKTSTTTRRRNVNANLYGQPNYYAIWHGSNQQGEQIDFPTANEFYDHASIQMLRQAFVSYKDAESTKDLLEHFQQQVKSDQTPESQKNFWKFGLGYLSWWNDDKDEALAILTDATNSLPNDPEMTFELAHLHEKRGDPQQALALIDSLPAADQQTMQKQEIAALRLSVNSGNIDRARTAAERLFGLRLDSNLQIQLARQMHQLAMHELAEAVLARAGRQAGNRTDVLMSLMQQYQAQGKNDVAVQIAHQLLRRSAGNAAQYAMGGTVTRFRGRGGDDSGGRQQALQVLKRSGKLPEMIARVEEQLKHSPKSQKLLETLIEYYSANGNNKKVSELSAKIAETKSDDPQFRFQLAMQLVQAGKHKESLEHFRVALKKEPRLLRNSYWEIQNAFENADKLDDLASLYEEIDLKSFRQNPWELTNLISNMSRRDKTKNRAVSLFKKAWQDLPDQRQQLLSNLNSDVFWKMPEIYDYARQGIIPTETSVQQMGRWAGFGNIQSWNNDGKMTTLLSRFLTIATQSKKLDELADEVRQARAKLKSWDAGEPLLALIELRQGKVDDAKAVFEKLLPTMKGVQQVGYYTHWEIAQELMSHEKCVDLAIEYLEAAVKEPSLMTNNEFPYTPAKPLTMLYKQKGRKEDARKLILKAINSKSEQNYGNPQYEAYRRIQNAITLGNEIQSLGFPVDAIRVYQQALARTDDLTTAQQFGGGDQKRQLQAGFQAALNAIRPESLTELLGAQESADGKQAAPLDLVLLIDSRELDKTSLTSALAKVVSSLTSKPELFAKTRDTLKEACQKRPDDVSSLVLAAQLAFAAKDTEAVRATIKQLVELVDRTPLEPQPEKGGFTARQREIAHAQMGLWLVAKECLKQESLRSEGTRLAERALEASRRNSDQGYSLAILREWGQIALETGDRPSAEKRWTEMLQIVIPKPANKPIKKEETTTSLRGDLPAEAGSIAVANNPVVPRSLSRWEQMLAPALLGQVAAPAAAPAVRAKPAAGNPGAAQSHVVTLSQFEQAAQIAKLAAENGFTELSLSAISTALRAGPPIEAMQAIDTGARGFPVIQQQANDEGSAVFQRVQERLTVVEQVWRRRQFDNVAVYGALKNAVLPEARPAEAFIYARPLSMSPNQAPQSLGLSLVQAAVRAGRVDDLKQSAEQRLQQPLSELPARILLTQLALASNDTADAGKHLEALAKRLEHDSLQSSSELVCHVAIPAISLPKTSMIAAAILERAVGHFAQNSQQGRNANQEEPLRTFRFTLARFHFASGNADAGKKHLQEYLNSLIPLYQNYGGGYGQYRRRQELMKVAAEFARAGQQADSLDCLGQYADLPVSANYGQDSPGRAGAMILVGLLALDPKECYGLLKEWTLPTADRKSVRVVAGLMPSDKAPEAFDELRGNVPRCPRDAQLLSTADLLIAVAQAAEKLDELQSELKPLAKQDVENARFLLLMTRIAQGEGPQAGPALNEYLEERRKALPNQGDYQKRPQLIDAVLARFAMRDPSLVGTGRELGVNFFLHGTRVQEHLLMAMMRHDYNSSLLGPDITARLDHEPSNTGLKYWTAGASASARTEANGTPPMWWICHEGLISHICGPDQSHLFFKCPLAGTFELSCDAWLGGWAEANHGYGGLAFVGLHGGSNTRIFPIGNRGDAIQKPDPLEQSGRFNRVSLKVQPDKVRYFVNGHLIHEESTDTSTSPWFFLHCDRAWQTCFRDIRIAGQPVIPREVHLSGKDSLLGWSTEFYGESQPARLASANSIPDEASTADAIYDWWAKDGVIHGRLAPAIGIGKQDVLQSRLFYDRPLLDGDRLKYEFWYEAGSLGSHVHPAFDRLALLLDPEGVKLHWMTDGIGYEDDYSGLSPSNVLVDKSCQKGKVALRDRAWNTVEISLKGDVATISLNGSVVCERTLEPDNSRQFGFYHDKATTDVKVRNVVLAGDWPKNLAPEVLADLLAPEREPTPDERRALGSAIEEKFHSADVDEILLRTRKLSAAERYQALKNWVLPNDDHTSFRMYGDTAPADPLPVTSIVIPPVNTVAKKTVAMAQAPRVERRQRFGGELIAPALDLVVVARELGKLDELAGVVQTIPDSSLQLHRSRLAMLTLIAIAANDFKQADTLLTALTPTKQQGLPDSLALADRWPELLAAWESTRIPELRKGAVALLEVMLDSVNRKGIGGAWDVKVRSARQHARFLLESEKDLPPASAVSPKGQWAQVTLVKASNRAAGMVPRWRFDGAQTLHLGGEGNDLIYFQSPLRGTFTVEGELSSFGWREGRAMYATEWAAPKYTLDEADLGNLYRNWVGPKFDVKLDPPGDFYRLKMQVTPDQVVYYVGDQIIHQHPLTDNCDPWLAIHSYGHYATATRSLRILGQPEIPAELNLSKRDDLQGWWADVYGDAMNNDNPAWKKDGDDIYGQKIAGWEGRSRESLLQYHRPLLEDGEITYDFLYVPDQTHVHPVLGRMVMVLTSDGVKVHWLTDAQFERGGLSPDNMFVEREFRRGPATLPLKSNEWNALTMNLQGDTVRLKLNGELVYERPVDPNNLRTFGLFHYAGDTDVRVKNVIYRGNWPRTLPSIKEQELAGEEPTFADFKEGDLPEKFAWNFTDRQPAQLQFIHEFPTTKRAPVNGGLRIVREPNSNTASQPAGFQWPTVSIGGDFEITLGYRDFESKTLNMTQQVPRVEIILALGGVFGQHSRSISLTHRRQKDGNMFLSSIQGVRRVPPDEEWQFVDKPYKATAARIRIVRRDGFVYYMVAKPDSDDWQVLERRPTTIADVKDLLIGLRSEDLQGTASVVLTEFSIRAKRLSYIPRFAEGQLPAQLAWNFQGAQPKALQKWGSEAPSRFEPVPDGMKFIRPEAPARRTNLIGYNWQGTLRGDFEITVGYRDFESTTDKTDWQIPRIELNLPIGGGENLEGNTHTATIGIRRLLKGNLELYSGVAVRQADGQKQWQSNYQKTERPSGRIRLVRTGSIIHALVAPAGSDEFVNIASRPASDGEIKAFSITVRSESPMSTASAIFTEFSIRAQQLEMNATAQATGSGIPRPAPFGPKALPDSIQWNFQGRRPASMKEVGNATLDKLQPAEGGVRAIRPAKYDQGWEGIGGQWNGELIGDFELTLDYRDFQSKPTLTDWRVPRLDISAAIFADSDNKTNIQTAGVYHRRSPDGSMGFAATLATRAPDGTMTYPTDVLTGAQSDSGRLRIVRQGKTIYFLTALKDAEEWQPIGSRPVDPGPVKSITFSLRCDDPDASAEAVLTGITIRAKEIRGK